MTTLETHIEAFLRSRRAKKLSVLTEKWYEWLLTEYRQYVEAEGLPWDSVDTLDRFFGDYLYYQELSENTIHAYFRALRAFFNWMERRKRLPGDNPIEPFEAPKKPKQLPRDVKKEAVERLLTEIDGERYIDTRDRAMILFLWDTGVRASELCGLELPDLDLENGQATIRNGKGGQDRVVAFGVAARETVETWLEARSERARCKHVFVNRSGAPFTRWGVRLMLRRRKIDIELDDPCHPHAFRHGFAKTYLKNGGSLNTLQHLMGHASLRSTEIYLKATDEEAQEDHIEASPGDSLGK